MAAGLQLHLLEQRPRGGLTPGEFLHRGLRGAQAAGEVVTHPFKLSEVEQARPVARRCRDRPCLRRGPAHLERADDDAGEPRLQMGDLPTQRRARGALDAGLHPPRVSGGARVR